MNKAILRLVIPEPDSGQKPPPCTSEDPELFFPDSEVAEHQNQIKQAKAVCRKCPMIASCLEFALDTHDKHAILGGTTPSERTVIHLKRTRRAERDARRRNRELKAA